MPQNQIPYTQMTRTPTPTPTPFGTMPLEPFSNDQMNQRFYDYNPYPYWPNYPSSSYHVPNEIGSIKYSNL